MYLFVYGTLKIGQWNHDHFCKGFVSVEERFVHGQLYEMNSGIPILKIPEDNVIIQGSNNILKDVEIQSQMNKRSENKIDYVKRSVVAARDKVHGELFKFDDVKFRLSLIDRLEGYNPDGRSFYRRVLIPVFSQNGSMIAAWAYVGSCNSLNLKLLSNGRWPSVLIIKTI